MAFLEKLVEKIMIKVLQQQSEQKHEEYLRQQQWWKDVLGPSSWGPKQPECAPTLPPTSMIDDDDTWVDDDTDTLVYSWTG